MKKEELKKQLNKLGVEVTGNRVKKKDIEKIMSEVEAPEDKIRTHMDNCETTLFGLRNLIPELRDEEVEGAFYKFIRGYREFKDTMKTYWN